MSVYRNCMYPICPVSKALSTLVRGLRSLANRPRVCVLPLANQWCVCFHWQRLSPHPCLKNPWINISLRKSTLFPQQKGKQALPSLPLFARPFSAIWNLIQMHSAYKISQAQYTKRALMLRVILVEQYLKLATGSRWTTLLCQDEVHLKYWHNSPPSSLRVSVWKWLPCGSREVRRWACLPHIPSACTHTTSNTQHTGVT